MPAPAPPSDLARLDLRAIEAMIAEGRRPPVERWDPPHCGHSAMRIDREGRWFHEGRPIARSAMVRLFASILRRERDGSFALVTPVEELAIDVEDAPFVAVEMKSEGAGKGRRLAFRTNVGDLVIADADHPLRVEEGPEGPRPVLTVRRGLEARIARPVFYELADIALSEGADPPGLWSRGRFFPLAEAR
jgi:uncharacterized protein